jgi:chromosome segregation ATPase
LEKVVDAVEKEDSRHAGALDELREDVNAMQQLEAQNVEALREKIRQDKIELERLLQEQKNLQTQLDFEKNERAKNALQNSEKIDALKLEYEQEIATLKTDTARNLKDFESSIEALKLNYDSKIGAVTNEKDALAGEIATFKDTIASLQGDITQKDGELEQVRQELERLKKSESLQAKDTDTLKQEKEVIGQEIAALETQKTGMEQALADLQKEMADVAARLKKHLFENKTEEGIIKLHTEVEKMIEQEMGMDGLIELLQNKQYVEFKARVQQKDVIKEKHSLPAQFLNCESIAATWRLFERPGAGPVSAVMAQKLMHHIRLYDSMEYDASLHRFTSRYFKKFETTLGYAVVASVPDAVATDASENLVPVVVGDGV